MTFKPATWYPIALVLTAGNLAAAAFAAAQAEALHASIHVALAVAFGLWAQRLSRGPDAGELQARLEALELELSAVRRELGEVQERVDFTERVLARIPESRRMGPER
ncbi:MAG: hypothetical protein ACHQ2E_03405 [Gemmatimonadales bacterium]